LEWLVAQRPEVAGDAASAYYALACASHLNTDPALDDAARRMWMAVDESRLDLPFRTLVALAVPPGEVPEPAPRLMAMDLLREVVRAGDTNSPLSTYLFALAALYEDQGALQPFYSRVLGPAEQARAADGSTELPGASSRLESTIFIEMFQTVIFRMVPLQLIRQRDSLRDGHPSTSEAREDLFAPWRREKG
jgi:hypothetical protein